MYIESLQEALQTIAELYCKQWAVFCWHLSGLLCIKSLSKTGMGNWRHAASGFTQFLFFYVFCCCCCFLKQRLLKKNLKLFCRFSLKYIKSLQCQGWHAMLMRNMTVKKHFKCSFFFQVIWLVKPMKLQTSLIASNDC